MEFGCGEGTFVEGGLRDFLPPITTYLGLTRVDVATQRLAQFGARASTRRNRAGVPFELVPRCSVDRVLCRSCWIDLLSFAEIAAFLDEAHHDL